MKNTYRLLSLMMVLLLPSITSADVPACLATNNCETVKVLRITPAGKKVPAGQQIVIHFNKPVVPLGDMAGVNVPVKIQPALACQWRWINRQTLACQLDGEQQLQLATRYRVDVYEGLIANKLLEQSFSQTFSTQAPRLTYNSSEYWRGPSEPVYRLSFDQFVTKTSVGEVINISSNGKSFPVVVEGFSYDDVDPISILENDVWLVSAKLDVPEAAAVSLSIKPGLVSIEGPVLGYENRVFKRFHTYPKFELLGVRCRLEKTTQHALVPLEALQNKQYAGQALPGCLPGQGVSLVFSSPVLNSQARDFAIFNPALNKGLKDYDPWANSDDWRRGAGGFRPGSYYTIWLPERLRAAETYEVSLGQEFRDEFGRNLQSVTDGRLTFAFDTSHREPKLKITHRVAVLESGVDSDVPLYVTNLDKIKVEYEGLNSKAVIVKQERQVDVEPLSDVAFKMPLKTRELLDDKSGVIFANLDSTPRPPGSKYKPKLLAQVTPFQVHAKVGYFNTTVWVTRFNDGKPVKRARVTLMLGNYDELSALKDMGYAAKTNRKGLAVLPGRHEYDPELDYQYGGPEEDMVFVRVDYKNDIAILPLNYDFRVWSDVYANNARLGEHRFAWGTSAQGVYKPGANVQYKVYLRDQSNKHWVAPDSGLFNLEVLDPRGNVVHERLDIKLNEFGALHGDFKLPENSALGHYDFQLLEVLNDDEDADEEDVEFGDSWQALSILVSDFTAAPFKVETQIKGEVFGPGDVIEVDTLASLYAGGPYADAGLRLNVLLQETAFTNASPIAEGFVFFDEQIDVASMNQTLVNIRETLNSTGEFNHRFTLKNAQINYGTLSVEAAVKDERGKFIAARGRAKYAGLDRFVGLKNTAWLYEAGKPAVVETLVSDLSGKLVAGLPISIQIQRLETRSAKVKSAGSAYVAENSSEWVEVSKCQLLSLSEAAACEFVPEAAGDYRFVATIVDSQGRKHTASIGAWVTGLQYVQWYQTNDNLLKIMPEQNTYKLGDVARYLVQNPIPNATALVTIERYGVIDSWTQTLEGSTPVIEVEITEDYLPGFYLSVVLQSPRIEQPLGKGQVDLGKPMFKMGYVETRVEDESKRIRLEVVTDKPVYRPGEAVKAKIKVLGNRRERRGNYEFAIAVVDDSVLALNAEGKTYYDPYQGFNILEALDVNNYSLLSRLIGRQKFEKKGANPGGGGGDGGAIRNNFKYVSYWNPSLSPNKKGEATFSFDVPDNLTAWSIIVLAVSPDDKLGIGMGGIKVNRPTELRPVMPNQVLAGDEFQAGFSIMNRSNRERNIGANVLIQAPDGSTSSQDFTLTLAPFERRKQYFPITTDQSGPMIFTITAGDSSDRDSMAYMLNVNKYDFAITASDSGLLDQSLTMPIELPEATLSAELNINLSATVMGDLGGAFDYLADYPHACFEQRLSRAVGASVYQSLGDRLPKAMTWPEAAEVIDSPLSSVASFQAPNGGMAYWVARDAYVSPYLSAYAALVFNWLEADGHEIDVLSRERLHAYLLRLLKRNDFPQGWSNALGPRLRANILAALAPLNLVDKNAVDRLRSRVDDMDLFAKAMYLQAVVAMQTDDLQDADHLVEQILNHANETTSSLDFSEPTLGASPYLLGSSNRSSCAILSSFVAYAEARENDRLDLDSLLPKLVNSINGVRKGLGKSGPSWANTQENAFCLQALSEYAERYEPVDKTAEVAISYQDKELAKELLSIPQRPVLTRTIDVVEAVSTLELSNNSDQRIYYSTSLVSVPDQQHIKKVNAGFDIRKEFSVEREGEFVQLSENAVLDVGDLVKVDLFLNVPAARYYVVIDDPMPGGLEPVNSQLATNSGLDAAKTSMAKDSYWFKLNDWIEYGQGGFYHQELGHDAARFYADRLRPGDYHLSYTAQVIAAGRFAALPVKVEEMYQPDTYGNGETRTLHVEAGGQ